MKYACPSLHENCSAIGAEDFNLYNNLIRFRNVKFCISKLHNIMAKFPVLYNAANDIQLRGSIL